MFIYLSIYIYIDIPEALLGDSVLVRGWERRRKNGRRKYYKYYYYFIVLSIISKNIYFIYNMIYIYIYIYIFYIYKPEALLGDSVLVGGGERRRENRRRRRIKAINN